MYAIISASTIKATDTQGQRVRVKAPGGWFPVTVGWDYSLNHAGNHRAAVIKFLQRNAQWYRGTNDKPYGYIGGWLNESATTSVWIDVDAHIQTEFVSVTGFAATDECFSLVTPARPQQEVKA